MEKINEFMKKLGLNPLEHLKISINEEARG